MQNKILFYTYFIEGGIWRYVGLKSYFLDLSLKVAAQIKNNETNRYSEATSVADDIDIDIDIDIIEWIFVIGLPIKPSKNQKIKSQGVSLILHVTIRLLNVLVWSVSVPERSIRTTVQ